jgi:hypothetical protein
MGVSIDISLLHNIMEVSGLPYEQTSFDNLISRSTSGLPERGRGAPSGGWQLLSRLSQSPWRIYYKRQSLRQSPI